MFVLHDKVQYDYEYWLSNIDKLFLSHRIYLKQIYVTKSKKVKSYVTDSSAMKMLRTMSFRFKLYENITLFLIGWPITKMKHISFVLFHPYAIGK